MADPPPLSVDEFEALHRDGAILLDCRSPEVFSAHIPWEAERLPVYQ